MKRIIAFMLALVLALGLIGCGSKPFTLRSGIVFGDKVADVKNKETELKLKKEESGKLKYSGSIVGYDGTATFFFGNDGGLTDMTYYFSSKDRASMTNLYNTIEESFDRKYGDALEKTGNFFSITGKAFEEAASAISTFQYYGSSGKLLDYAEWVVYGKDGNNVKIELTMVAGSYLDTTDYVINAGYTSFSQKELDTEINEKDSVF